MSDEEFKNRVTDLIARFDVSFSELQKLNDKGKITIVHVSPIELQIKVNKVGIYRIYTDSDYLCLQSPLSGVYNYKYEPLN